MDDWNVMAAWLRQRTGETDQQWVQRLCDFFEGVARERAEPTIDDPKTVRIMDRAWKRYMARVNAAAKSLSDDT